MSSGCRAFYHDKRPGDPLISYDPTRQVSLEILRSLKYHTSFIEGPDYVQHSRKIARDLGFLLAGENSKVVWDFIGPGRKGGTQMSSSKPSRYMASFDILMIIVSGMHCVDIEDPISGSLIRIERGPGTVQLIPAGSLGCFVPCAHKAIMFIQSSQPEYQLVRDEDVQKFALHREYLKSIGL
ncbi:hypothetical protein J3R30DRAFT_2893990 [Lentinula aciculospora]|uniref:Uncharacterized protein n=1 Tax=Lentinula aciculospora TaxID=153920 RepID=A0A9W9AAN1_9AGAR|nr:hypothetical protein J3R30DRAFT_2893990 [Lentinula aciculospora]